MLKMAQSPAPLTPHLNRYMLAIKDFKIRNLDPVDYSSVISEINDWWDGRNMVDMLPKLFFVHFTKTSFVIEHHGKLVAFLVGFRSQTFPNESYIHFVGVHPEFRNKSLGRTLYERFFEVVTKLECNVAHCVTSPANKGSIAFHLRMGFYLKQGKISITGIPVIENYDGPGEDRILFSKTLGENS